MKKLRLFNVVLFLLAVLFVQYSFAQNDNPLSLPEGAKARLGKGLITLGAIAYSPDGTRLAVSSSLGIWLYDAHTGTEVALLQENRSISSILSVLAVAFSPDGSTLA